MPTLEERVETLERRFSDLEGQVGFLIPLTRQLHREILTVREDLERVENKMDERFEKIDQRFERVDQRFERIERTLDALPRAVAEKPLVVVDRLNACWEPQR